MHQLMNNMVKESGDDADILVIIDDPTQKISFAESLIEKINAINLHKIFLINKIDKITPQQYVKALQNHKFLFGDVKVQGISALNSIGIEEIKKELLEYLPEHVAYYPKDYISDKPIRFFIAELIREQIYLAFSEEIPYSIYVEIDTCTGVDEQAELARIESTIYVNRLSQVPIILGKNGVKIKDLGIKSRIEIEKYLGQRVYLGLSVKVKENWRDDKILIEKKGILR
ncbi:MAG: GTPase Era, partial [Saprospiraceae bacterium]